MLEVVLRKELQIYLLMAKLPVEFILHTLFLVSITTSHKQSNGRSIRTINNEFCSDISSVERFSNSLTLIVLEK